jgi:hypothetical protein
MWLKIVKNRNIFMLIIFLLAYLLLFSSFRDGVGNYWDWSFPYFSDHLTNYFSNMSLSYIPDNLGNPLSYSSNYYFRYLISLFGYLGLAPEILQYLLLSISATIASFFFYRTHKRDSGNNLLVVVASFVLIINPAVFYKFVGGHTYYMVSLAILSGLYFYLMKNFRPNIKGYLALSLFLAFVGVQIQFFVIAGIMMFIYFIFHKEKFRLIYLPLLLIVPILINLPWLSNFISSAYTISQVGGGAAFGSFKSLTEATFRDVFYMSFSRATLLQYYYSSAHFAIFALFSVLFLVQLFLSKFNKKMLFIITLMIVYFIFATGLLQSLNIPYLNKIYPMIREVGHFAPILVFCMLSYLLQIKSMSKSNQIVMVFSLFVFLFTNLTVYWGFVKLPKPEYNLVRQHFEEFEDIKKNDTGSYRVLTYPFFNQYSLNNVKNVYARGRLINNSGWDSYIMYSGYEYINQNINSKDYYKSLQYRLLRDFQTKELEELNVKYVFDFSHIYQTNYEKYLELSEIGYDVDMIKANKDFIDSIAGYPGVIKISEHVYQLPTSTSRLYHPNLTFQKINPAKYKLHFKGVKDVKDLNFLQSYHSKWNLYLDSYQKPCLAAESSKECSPVNAFYQSGDISYINKEPLFDSTHSKKFNYANSWSIDPNEIKKFAEGEYYQKNSDGSIDFTMTLYFAPQSYQYLGIIISILAVLVVAVIIVYSKIKLREYED